MSRSWFHDQHDVRVTDAPLWMQLVDQCPEEWEDAFDEMLERHPWFALVLELRAERALARHRADGVPSRCVASSSSPGDATSGDLAA